ncbi:MAG: hypothetical protein M1827_005544 [Pycnora praestabilis]|nr:MAG: hypothetical protein M1827_005544 [Pycnora praestabilis]
MFWRFGGYANISTLDTILDKPDVTLEELLDESDLIQELKQHNTKLIEYLRDENVLRRLLEYVVAPKLSESDNEDADAESNEARGSSAQHRDGDEKSKGKSREQIKSLEDREKEEKTRLKYAYVACEVLSSETWSISEALMENQQHLRTFWSFMKHQPPLDPLQAGYFTKVNETLLDKKTEEMLEFFKSLGDIVPSMLQHVDCPMVMDLLLKIISLEKADGGQGIVDVSVPVDFIRNPKYAPRDHRRLTFPCSGQWLQSQSLIPKLLSYLSAEHSPATQTSGGDFLKAIITISANASQNEQSCIGPNDLTRQLVSEPCIQSLISNMLRGGNPLTVGVGIVIEVIRKNNSDYDPDVGAGADSIPSSRDPIYLGTLLRLFAKHVPDYMDLILSPNHTVINGDGTSIVKRKELRAAFGEKIEPLGFDRFKTCELMAELLHCSNMGLLNERGSERFVKERDQERERLKKESDRPEGREALSEAEFKEDSNGVQNGASPSALGSGSSDEIRRLEVQNGGEEDGFEDVSVSGVLNEDVKDDFDEKPDAEAGLQESQVQSIDQPMQQKSPEEDEFVDEPLSSPRIEPRAKDQAVEKDISSLLAPSTSEKEPLSPTSSGLTDRVSGLDLDNDTIMTSPPPSEPGEDDLKSEHAFVTPNPSTNHKTDGKIDHDLISSGEQAVADQHTTKPVIITTDSIQVISPHPDDKPAPLFAGRSHSATLSSEHTRFAQDPGQEAIGDDSQGTVDTTHGEEGDSGRSILMRGHESGFEPHIETDVDGSPVVGDFLKMMFVEHRVVPTILDFFFRFPWNNFLHNVVYDVVQQVFNGPMERGYNRNLAIDLFETGRITERIVEGQQRSDKAQAETNMRLGYMGHLTLIAEEVVKFSERHPPELLSQSVLEKVSNHEWINYVEQTLAETRERDNAILGGVRPDLAVGPRQAVINAVNAAQGFGSGASNALANAGLTGGNGQGLDSVDLANSASASSGGFNLTGGSLLSGFGSGSSDEEDEEMEEGEDDEGTRSHGTGSEQISHYINPSIYNVDKTASTPTDSSDAPPNAPPPPPPLNILPSRARRQLAARLALHKKTISAAPEQGSTLTGVNNAEDLQSEAGHEPFAVSSPSNMDDIDVSPIPQYYHHEDRFVTKTISDLFEQSSSSSSSGSEDNDDDDDDLAQTGSSKALGPRRPSTTEAQVRSALEADDEDEDEEGEVVDFGKQEEEEEEEEEDEREGLVEIRKPRRGDLLETHEAGGGTV